MNYAKYASRNAWFTAFVFLVLLTIFIVTGVSQQPFEGVRTLSVHIQQLKEHSFWLQTLLALDNVFIVLYVTTSLLITLALKNARNQLLLAFFLGGVTLVGFLDFAENHHFASQLASVTANLPIPATALQIQMVLSTLKWHIGYFAFFTMGFAIEPRSRWEHIFQALLFIQLPFGVMAYTTYSPAITRAFVLIRYFNFLIGFVAFAWLMRVRSTEFRSPQLAADPAEGHRTDTQM